MAGWCLLKSAKLECAWGLNDHVPGVAEPTPHVFPIFHGPPVLSGFLLCRQFTRYPHQPRPVYLAWSSVHRLRGGEPLPLPAPPWAAEHPVSSRQSWGLWSQACLGPQPGCLPFIDHGILANHLTLLGRSFYV